MWPFQRGDERKKASPNATPKISHLHYHPRAVEANETDPLANAAQLRSYHDSQSLDAILDDDHHAHQQQQHQQQQQQQHRNQHIIIEGKPGDWRRGSSDEDSLSFRSFHTGVHTLESVSSLLSGTAHVIVNSSFRFSGKEASIRDFGGTASIPNEVFNMIKNLVGAGALGLPSGVAAFANNPSALIPACIVIVIMGLVFGYYFLIMGRLCAMTRATSYREVWEITMGDHFAGVVPLAIILMASLGNLAYSMILADTTKSLLVAAGLTSVTRTQSLIGVTVLALLPLCMVKNLSVLAPFSLLGLLGLVFTVGVIVLRFFDGTYDPEQGGEYLEGLPEEMQPSFGNVGASGAWSSRFLIIVCMTFQAYFAHYNAPRYFVELKNNTIGRFSTAVASSFGFSAVIYIVLTTFSFLTFGGNCDGNILNNYSTRDNLASCCRLTVAIALVCTYPLPFIGVRDGILDLLMVPESKQTSQNLNALSVVELSVFTGLAMCFTDLGLLNAVGGGALGTAVVFILPALMFRGAIKHLGTEATIQQRREVSFAMGLMWIGTVVGVVGTVVGLTMT